MKKDFWISYNTVADLINPAIWDDYLIGMENLLDDTLEKLDTNDPIRRNADTKNQEGKYITNFKEGEESKWIFGRFKKSKIRMQIWIFKRIDDRPNTIDVKFPDIPHSNADIRQIMQIFDFGNLIFSPFYSYADMTEVIFVKVPSTPCLNISRELLGIFWLTYLNRKYCDFFGTKIQGCKFGREGPNSGIVLQLDDTIEGLSPTLRSAVEAYIGVESFANGPPAKELGRFALTLQQLAEE